MKYITECHAGIHVTIHRINPVSDFFIKSYQTVASPLLRTSKRLQSSILPLLKEEAEGGKQKNLLFGKRLDMQGFTPKGRRYLYQNQASG